MPKIERLLSLSDCKAHSEMFVIFILLDKYDIEASLHKINPKFVEEMTEEEKQTAIQSFKKVYAMEMSKASDEMVKRKKVYENLYGLKKQQQNQLQSIEEDLNQKMANFEKNRSKHKESKTKEHKLLEQNWKRRWETIVKKRRTHQNENFQKAEKVRKQTEQYFAKKKQFFLTSKTKKSNNDTIDENQINYYKKSNCKSAFGKDQRSVSIDHYKISSLYRGQPLPTINRKTSSKKGFESMNLTLNLEQTPQSKGAQMKYNREKFQKVTKQKQQQNFQKMVNKFQRIQKNRQNAQERKQRLVIEAKKLRQQRENPEKLARNRQRSLDALNLRRRARQGKQRSIQNSSSKLRLNDSIHQHREAKKMIEQAQFNRRQQSFQAKFQKIKKTKIDKIVKEAVHNLKHDTLSHHRERSGYPHP